MDGKATRLNVRYAATWRLLAELLRRHQARDDLRLYWFFPGISGNGVARLRRPDGTTVLDLDVVHAVVGSDAEDPHGGGRYVDAMLAADDPKTVVDAVEERGGLGRAKKPLPESNAPVLCARVIAGVLERRMLARGVIRTSPGYFDQAGYVVALDWAAEVAGVTEELARARASGREHYESPFVQHLFALHASEAVLGQGAPVETRFVAFDLRTGGAHVVHRGSQARSSLSLLDAYAASGRRLGPLLDWVETWL